VADAASQSASGSDTAASISVNTAAIGESGSASTAATVAAVESGGATSAVATGVDATEAQNGASVVSEATGSAASAVTSASGAAVPPATSGTASSCQTGDEVPWVLTGPECSVQPVDPSEPSRFVAYWSQ
jgi:hypothetical protein